MRTQVNLRGSSYPYSTTRLYEGHLHEASLYSLHPPPGACARALSVRARVRQSVQ
jgi:hypothetical protein